MWPATACRSEFDEQSRGGFVTVAMAMRAIITCLAGGSDPVSKSVTYSLPYAIKDFGRYLYDDIANPSGAAPKPAR